MTVNKDEIWKPGAKVELTRSLPSIGLQSGAIGRVVYDFGEVEFQLPNGRRARIIMTKREVKACS